MLSVLRRDVLSFETTDDFDQSVVESFCDTEDLLYRNLASLFLKMQTVLHVSDIVTQEIVEHLTQIFSLSQPLIKRTLRGVLPSHDIVVTETSLDQIVSIVMNSNIFVSAR